MGGRRQRSGREEDDQRTYVNRGSPGMRGVSTRSPVRSTPAAMRRRFLSCATGRTEMRIEGEAPEIRRPDPGGLHARPAPRAHLRFPHSTPKQSNHDLPGCSPWSITPRPPQGDAACWLACKGRATTLAAVARAPQSPRTHAHTADVSNQTQSSPPSGFHSQKRPVHAVNPRRDVPSEDDEVKVARSTLATTQRLPMQRIHRVQVLSAD